MLNKWTLKPLVSSVGSRLTLSWLGFKFDVEWVIKKKKRIRRNNWETTLFITWSRAKWLKEPNPEAEDLFRMVAEVFIYWSKSHVSRKISTVLAVYVEGFQVFDQFSSPFSKYLGPCFSSLLSRCHLTGVEREQIPLGSLRQCKPSFEFRKNHRGF